MDVVTKDPEEFLTNRAERLSEAGSGGNGADLVKCRNCHRLMEDEQDGKDERNREGRGGISQTPRIRGCRRLKSDDSVDVDLAISEAMQDEESLYSRTFKSDLPLREPERMINDDRLSTHRSIAKRGVGSEGLRRKNLRWSYSGIKKAAVNLR